MVTVQVKDPMAVSTPSRSLNRAFTLTTHNLMVPSRDSMHVML